VTDDRASSYSIKAEGSRGQEYAGRVLQRFEETLEMPSPREVSIAEAVAAKLINGVS
jgi:hypothetical protein